MALNPARLRSLRLVSPEISPFQPLPSSQSPQVPEGGINIDLNANSDETKLNQGVGINEHGDGSATFDFNPQLSVPDILQNGHYRNLALDINEGELGRIASDLLDGIRRDDDSRKEWLETRARGITLLGLKLEEPRGDLGMSSAPLEGMSTVRHPLLLGSVLRFQANARGELLPAAGPIKIRNDATIKPNEPPPAPPPQAAPPPSLPAPAGGQGGPLPPGAGPPPMQAPAPSSPIMAGSAGPNQLGAPAPGPAPGGPAPGGPVLGGPAPGGPAPAPPMPPMTPMMGHNGGPPMFGLMNTGELPGMNQDNEELASALETDMNHYLTAIATEYYPDTDRMLFWIGAGGQGIKKVYNCPLRRRPVSESVDAEDIIVSNATTNLENSGRITHRIKMRPSVLKRMQIIGAYRDVPLSKTLSNQTVTTVDRAKAEIQGVKLNTQRSEDVDEEIYETYCELNIAGFEHKGRSGKITGLQCPYKVTIHIQSRQILEIRRNWEEGDDLCMPKQFFVDFPFVRALGFYGIGLIHIAGNTTSALTAAWREMLDAGMFASFPGFLYAKPVGRQLTNQFRVPPGGGVPLDVGTGRLSDSVMPLPYKEPGAAFTAFVQSVQEYGERVAGAAEINIGEGNQDVPVGTTMALIEQATKVMDAVHKRLHTAQANEFKLLKERFKDDPEAFWRHNKRPSISWRREQFLRALENNDLVPVADPNNPTSLHRIAKATVIKTLQQANPAIYDAIAVDKRIMRTVGIDAEGLFKAVPDNPPDPKLLDVQQRAQAQQAQSQVRAAELQLKASTMGQQMQDRVAERESRERVEEMKILGERMRLQQEELIHANDLQRENVRSQRELESKQQEHFMDIARQHADAMDKIHQGRTDHMENLIKQDDKHKQSLQQADEQHRQKLQSAKELNQAKVEAARAMARAKPKSKT